MVFAPIGTLTSAAESGEHSRNFGRSMCGGCQQKTCNISEMVQDRTSCYCSL